jgi:hypothetical protein
VVSLKIQKGKERQGKGKSRDGDVCKEKECRALCLELPVEVKDSSFSFELAQEDHIILHPEAKRLRIRACVDLGLQSSSKPTVRQRRTVSPLLTIGFGGQHRNIA